MEDAIFFTKRLPQDIDIRRYNDSLTNTIELHDDDDLDGTASTTTASDGSFKESDTALSGTAPDGTFKVGRGKSPLLS